MKMMEMMRKVGVGVGVGVGFKHISTILKGSEQAPNFVESPFSIVSG